MGKRAKGAREFRTSLISPKNSTLERPGAQALCAPDARGPGGQLFCASLLKLRVLCAAAVRFCSDVIIAISDCKGFEGSSQIICKISTDISSDCAEKM